MTGSPETEPPGGLVALLSRWEASGGHWRIAHETHGWVAVDLVSCGSEAMSRVTGARTAVLTEFLDGRTANSP